VGSASRGRFLQWILAKLFLTVEALEERRLIGFSKRDRGEHKRTWLEATPQEIPHLVFIILLDVVPELTQRLQTQLPSDWNLSPTNPISADRNPRQPITPQG
jgi:hypothetical protein